MTDVSGTSADLTADLIQNSTRRARQLALGVCLAAGFTTLLDSSIVNLAVPSLTRSLHASTEEVQWLLSSYSLTFGLALVPGGRLGDLRGRRALFLGGVALFAVGSLVSGLAPAAGAVIFARLLQGTGGGVISSQVLGTIQDLFDARGRAKAMGAYGVASGVAGLSGPLLGALLVTVLPLGLGWRAVVIVSAPLAAVTFAFGTRYLPRSTPARLAAGRAAAAARARVDLGGLALLAVATLALVIPFVQPGLGRAATVGLVAAALAALALFVGWERRAGRANPAAVILAPALTRAPGFVAGTLVAAFWFGAQLAQQAVVTLYLLDTLGMPPLLVAAVALPSSAAGALSAAMSWRIVARFGTRAISVALAAHVLLIGTVALTLPHLTADGAVPLLVVVNGFAGVASGCIDAQNRAHTLQHSPDAARGVAAGFLQLAQRLSATVCIAAATGIALTDGPAQPSARGLGLALGLCAGLIALSLLVSLRRN